MERSYASTTPLVLDPSEKKLNVLTNDFFRKTIPMEAETEKVHCFSSNEFLIMYRFHKIYIFLWNVNVVQHIHFQENPSNVKRNIAKHVHFFATKESLIINRSQLKCPVKKCYFISFILHMPTVDCGELLRYIPQLDKQEGWITYPPHGNSKTAETAGNRCYVTKVIAD
jgi:hypothetical protein